MITAAKTTTTVIMYVYKDDADINDDNDNVSDNNDDNDINFRNKMNSNRFITLII